MNEQSGPALFQDAGNMSLMNAADAAAVARATQEIQAALVIAQRFERNEVKAKTRILEACKRKELAEVAEYEYSRGGTRITGPTIDLLRAIANRWGNIRYGWTEVDRRDGASMVRCFAWDLQSNGQAERTFSVKHWRDTSTGGYAVEDERDIYEILANSAARRVRACLEEVIDSDIVTSAVDECRKTMREGQKIPLKDRAVQMTVAFAEFGVTQAQIETRLGNKLEAVSENQLASLRRVYKSLKDGVGKREDYFKPETTKPEFTAPAPKAEVIVSPPPAAPSEPSFDDAAPAAPQPTNPVAALRQLAKAAGIKEGKILEFLNDLGATGGDVGSLEELQLQYPELVQRVLNDWGDISARILSVLKASKKA